MISNDITAIAKQRNECEQRILSIRSKIKEQKEMLHVLYARSVLDHVQINDVKKSIKDLGRSLNPENDILKKIEDKINYASYNKTCHIELWKAISNFNWILIGSNKLAVYDGIDNPSVVETISHFENFNYFYKQNKFTIVGALDGSQYDHKYRACFSYHKVCSDCELPTTLKG